MKPCRRGFWPTHTGPETSPAFLLSRLPSWSCSLMTRDPHCIFCKIIAGEIPATKVLETPVAVGFLDISPVAPGHTLLITKDHFPTLADTPPEVVGGLAAELPRLARAVLAATGGSGINLVQNNGRAAGQVVDHVHFHLIPRS